MMSRVLAVHYWAGKGISMTTQSVQKQKSLLIPFKVIFDFLWNRKMDESRKFKALNRSEDAYCQ